MVEVTQENAIEGWNWVGDDRRFRYPPHTPIEAGKTYVHEGPINLCKSGLHASRRAMDSLAFASGHLVSRVRCWGRVIEADDKFVCDHREVLWIADAESTLHRYACDVAARALDLAESTGLQVDPRSRRAIEVKRQWIDGTATEEELDAAKDAAKDAVWGDSWGGNTTWAVSWDAGCTAAYSALASATGDTARRAAWHAGWSASRSAALIASKSIPWSVARSIAWDEYNQILESMLVQLSPQ